MTALSIATASAHAGVKAIATILSRIRCAFAWYAGVIAEARIQQPPPETETYRDHDRLGAATDDDLPVII